MNHTFVVIPALLNFEPALTHANSSTITWSIDGCVTQRRDILVILLLPGLASLLASSRGSSINLIGASIASESRYVRAEVTRDPGLAAAPGRVALYVALPPAVTIMTCTALSRMSLSEWISLALENRAGCYDRAGALVAMIQSHLLLVLALAAMEPPASPGADDLREAMAQVLRATSMKAKNGSSSRRARYAAGLSGGRSLPAYVDEDGVDASLGDPRVRPHAVRVRGGGRGGLAHSGTRAGRVARRCGEAHGVSGGLSAPSVV